MGKPIFMVAGQSNATNLESELTAAMGFLLSPDSYSLDVVADPGSPLTWARGDGELDWATQSELPMRLLTAFTDLLDADPTARLGALLWLQGEADTLDIARATEYAARLEALFGWLRAELSQRYGTRDIGLDSFRIVLSGLSDHADEASRAKWATIQQQLALAAGRDPGMVLVDPDAVADREGVSPGQMFRDELHYSDSFARILADALVEALIAPGLTDFPGLRDGTYQAGDGADWIDPGRGGQMLAGGRGNDTYIVDSQFDRIAERDGEGDDRVIANVSFTLRDHSQALEGLILTGGADLRGIGNGLDNLMRGNAGSNDLRGAWGNDTIYGGGGDDDIRGGRGRDLMAGGRGNDRYWFDDPGDFASESPNGGHDAIVASISVVLWKISQSIEDLTLTGTGNLTGIGNMAANVIQGNAGANYLNGGGGNDTLSGGAGADTLVGDRGDDRLYGGTQADTFVFRSGAGHDVIADFGGADRLLFQDLTRADLTLHQDGADVVIAYGADWVRVEDVTLADLGPDVLTFG